MLQPDKDPPTFTAWSQRREHGKFREWYKRGHAWVEIAPDGRLVSFRVFEGTPGPRGYDGYIHCFPNGEQPPDPAPEESKRPGSFPDE
jgi:hypothetical protein